MSRCRLTLPFLLVAAIAGCRGSRFHSGTEAEPIRYSIIGRGAGDSMTGVAAKAAEVEAGRAASGGGLFFRIEREVPTAPTVKAQAELIDRVAATKPDGILLALSPGDEVNAAIQKASASEIPVVCLWQDSPKSGRLVACAPNDVSLGEELARQLLDARKGMSSGKIAILSLNAKADSLQARIQGIRQHVKNSAPSTKVLEPLYCDGDPEKAQTLVREALRKNPDIQALILLGDWILAKDDGLAAVPKSVTVVSADVSTETRTALRLGKIARVVAPRSIEAGRAGIFALEQLRREVKLEFAAPIDTGFDILYPDERSLPIGELRSGIRVFSVGQYDIRWSDWLDKGVD